MGQARKSYKREPHLFDTDVYALKRYNTLLKEANVWQGQSQYWMAHQCRILSTMLLNNDTSKIDVIVKSEDHFRKTKKFM